MQVNVNYITIYCVAALCYVSPTTQLVAERPLSVTIVKLVKRPQEFSGKEISMVGYFDRTQTHSAFICSDARSARSLEADDIDARIFVDLKPSQLTNPAIKLIDHGYVRVVGTFQYRSTHGRFLGPDPKNPGRFIWESSVGFGWGGIYSMQITNVKQLTPLPRS